MKFKLIAIDVDGTLLDDEHRMTDNTKKIIKKVHDMGTNIVLCTGRGPTSTLPLLEEIGIEGTVITHNGGATIRSADKQVLKHIIFSSNQVKQFIHYCRKHELHFDVNTIFDLYAEKVRDDVKRLYQQFMIEPILIPDVFDLAVPIVKMSVFGEIAEVDQTEKDWKQLADSSNNIIRMTRSGDVFIDLIHHDATKGNALKYLAGQWAVDREEILAIGNYYNDLDMIEFAGTGVAMGNSPDEVKSKADMITDSNNEEGLFKVISNLC